jgi:formate dehydrogenase major subunit
VSVDGRPVPPGGTLLETCREAGVELPAFCHEARTGSRGHCRACLVVADGRWVAACTTEARPGMQVFPDTPEPADYRRDLAELMLAESRPRGSAGTWIAATGALGRRYVGRANPHPCRDASHAILALEPGACILCRRCVAVCAGVQGEAVFAVTGRGAESRLLWGEGSLRDSACVSCGACAEVCPSHAIQDGRPDPAETYHGPSVRTTCGYCGVGCQMDVSVGATGLLVRGADTAPNHGHLCVKGRYGLGFARHGDRLTQPLLRRDGRLVPVDWPEALLAVAEGHGARRGPVAALSSSRCTNEENDLVQKWFRGWFGTNDVECCARACHAPSAVALRRLFGTGAATSSFDDLERADLILVAGANPTAGHPVVGARIRQAVLRKARLLVIDPRRTELAALADLHLQPRPGTSVPLLLSLAEALIRSGCVDAEFVARRTTGFAGFLDWVSRFPAEATEARTGVPAALVREAARMLVEARAPLQFHGLGMTEHHQGSEGVMLLAALAMLRGAVGRDGAGVNPLRGQNDVQGSDFGTAEAVALVTETVPPGTVFLPFHFPETGTNRVATTVLDRLADYPESKVTAVEVAVHGREDGKGDPPGP